MREVKWFGIGGAGDYDDPAVLKFEFGDERVDIFEGVNDQEVRDLVQDIESHGFKIPQ